MRIGRVQEIWRYPVKSMGGERLPSAEILSGGIPGDRGWAVRDEVNGGIRGAKKLPGLMGCQARYLEPPKPERAGPAEIVLPDGTQLTTDAPDAAARISAAIGHAVTLWPLQPADQLDHYRRGAPTHSDVPTELRAVFGLLPDEPLPDLSGMPREVFEFESPPGPYFDAFPLLVLTDASLRTLAARALSSVIDVRRFRPNLLVTTEPSTNDFVEAAWEGKHLRVGDATLALTAACPRCVMTTHGFADLPKDPRIMRTLVKEAQHKLGIYARVAEPGPVALGDPVELLP
jgi:uncharacterized protein YcbX